MIDLEDLEKKARASTQVVSWYSHGNEDGTVRGPFMRWFKCAEVKTEYQKHVSSVEQDCEYAAAAMNAIPTLIEVIRKQREALEWYAEKCEQRNIASHTLAAVGEMIK